MISQRSLLLCLLASGTSAFSVLQSAGVKKSALSASNQEEFEFTTRRSFVGATAVAIASLAAGGLQANAEQAPETRQGIEVTPFNGLTFNYRSSDFGGLDAEDLDEPSVPYKEFCQRLKNGDVEFVEFYAPDGDKAYVTFKAKEGEAKPAPIRIGEGYPIEQHDGWSSPAFAVRTVKNAGVPYKFTVPGLAKYSTKS